MYIYHKSKINSSRFSISKIHLVVSTLVFLFVIQVSSFSDQESLVLHLQNLDSYIYKILILRVLVENAIPQA